MKTTSQNGIALVKRHEGLRLTAYKCPAGVWTIGYGHTRGVKEGMTITEAQAEAFLRQDLKTAESAVNRQLSNITQNQFDALVSFTFNVGVGAFERSTLLRKAKENPADLSIRTEFKRWNKAGNICLPGLAMRRNEEANLYFTK